MEFRLQDIEVSELNNVIKIIKSKVEKIWDRYKNSSIQFMISISFTIISIIGIVIVGTSLYLRFIKTTEYMIEEDNRAMLNQVNLNLDSYLRNMMKVSDTMYYRVIKNTDLSTNSINKEMNLLYEANKDLLISISVFSDYGEVIASSPLDKLKKAIDPRLSEWFYSAVNKKENLHFSTPHVQNLYEYPNYKYRWVVSLSRAVELTTNGEISHGVLLVDMNFSGIEQICKNTSLGDSGYVYLINEEGEIIYHPRQQLIYSNLIKENNKVTSNYEDGSHMETFEGEKRLVTIKTVGYTGWKIVGITPMADIASKYYKINVFVIFIGFFSIFILTFFNMFVSSRITNPIKALERSVKELENGVKDVNISVSGSYEIQHLGKTIRSMVEQMHTLMDNMVAEQESKRKKELDVLQSQINPHFLYNTLDSIVWMIENENYEGSIVMVTALARLFRISLSKGKNIITVGEELEHAKNYLTIQNIRYKNKFIYTIEAEEKTLSLASMKLIVQPIIENAIYHGMEFMGGDGEILIKAYSVDSDLYIDIIDNGLGMTEDMAESLLSNVAISKSTGSGIGLKNVHERIQLYFGKKYGLKIISEPDEGTKISIHMPVRDFCNINDREEGIL